MDALQKFDRLIKCVDELMETEYALAEGPLWEELRNLDAELEGECQYLGVQMPAYTLSVSRYAARVPFGFVKLPRGETNYGPRIYPTDEWRQAMRGLRAAVQIALERQIDPSDIGAARTLAGIADFAETEFGDRPGDRTIQKWKDEGSLRCRLRGQLWEFSKSDLKALVGAKRDKSSN